MGHTTPISINKQHTQRSLACEKASTNNDICSVIPRVRKHQQATTYAVLSHTHPSSINKQQHMQYCPTSEKASTNNIGSVVPQVRKHQ